MQSRLIRFRLRAPKSPVKSRFYQLRRPPHRENALGKWGKTAEGITINPGSKLLPKGTWSAQGRHANGAGVAVLTRTDRCISSVKKMCNGETCRKSSRLFSPAPGWKPTYTSPNTPQTLFKGCTTSSGPTSHPTPRTGKSTSAPPCLSGLNSFQFAVIAGHVMSSTVVCADRKRALVPPPGKNQRPPPTVSEAKELSVTNRPQHPSQIQSLKGLAASTSRGTSNNREVKGNFGRAGRTVEGDRSNTPETQTENRPSQISPMNANAPVAHLNGVRVVDVLIGG